MKLTRDKLSALLGFKGQDKAIGSEKKPTHASESQMDLSEKEQTDSIRPILNKQTSKLI
jgi:hypothetical protein